MDWRSLILRTIEHSADPATLLVARLMANPEFELSPTPEAAREQEFRLRGGGSRATYHRHKKALLKSRGGFDEQSAQTIRLQPYQRDLRAVAMAEQREYIESLRHSGAAEP